MKQVINLGARNIPGDRHRDWGTPAAMGYFSSELSTLIGPLISIDSERTNVLGEIDRRKKIQDLMNVEEAIFFNHYCNYRDDETADQPMPKGQSYK